MILIRDVALIAESLCLVSGGNQSTMNKQTIDITLTINNVERNLIVGKEEYLLDTLRNASYFSVKRGCDTGHCGVCLVLLDGKPILSCKIKSADIDGRTITTVEGLSENGNLHPIQRAFVETGAIQCGFCTPSQVLAAKALLDGNPNPSETDIRHALRKVFCRCTGYVRTLEAVMRAAAFFSCQCALYECFCDV